MTDRNNHYPRADESAEKSVYGPGSSCQERIVWTLGSDQTSLLDLSHKRAGILKDDVGLLT
jgi:hypothetical protein